MRKGAVKRKNEPTPSAGKKARTRAKLVEAASAAIAEKGFQRTSLDDIAARAGMTKGAIYSNFKTKEDLFLAVVATRSLSIQLDPRDSPNMRDLMRRAGDAAVKLLPQARAQGAFVAEFFLYVLTHEPMRKRMARDFEKVLAQTAPWCASVPPQALRVPAAALPVITQSLALGFLYQSFLAPKSVTEDVIRAVFNALASDEA